MELKFVKLNPTQNMTLLVESPLRREDYAKVADSIMAYESVYAEQVGFIERPGSGSKAVARLQMAGGEFCGNAAMSLAAYVAWLDKKEKFLSGARIIPLEVSGSDEVIE